MSRQSIQINQVTSDLKHKWDAYVNAHNDHSPYHLWGWGQAVQQAYGYQALNIAAFIDDKLVGICSVILMSKFGVCKSLCSLPYCDLGGVLADSETIKEHLAKFINNVVIAKKCHSFELREVATESFELSQLDGKKVIMQLPLPSSSDELMSSFKSKLRSQIRKSEKNGLVYELGTGSQFVESFYAVLSVNMHRLGSPVHSLQWFKSVAEHYRGKYQIVLVKKQHQVIAVGFILYSASKVSIPWASTLIEFNKLAPNMMVYWALLKFSCELGCKQFDFGRSTFGEGTYKFKQQWGAIPVALNWSSLPRKETNSNELLLPNNSSFRPLFEKMWQALPLALANKLGPVLRKHISL